MIQWIFLPAVALAASCTAKIDNDLVYAVTTYTFIFKQTSDDTFEAMRFDFSEDSGIKISDTMHCEGDPDVFQPVPNC